MMVPSMRSKTRTCLTLSNDKEKRNATGIAIHEEL